MELVDRVRHRVVYTPRYVLTLDVNRDRFVKPEDACGSRSTTVLCRGEMSTARRKRQCVDSRMVAPSTRHTRSRMPGYSTSSATTMMDGMVALECRAKRSYWYCYSYGNTRNERAEM